MVKTPYEQARDVLIAQGVAEPSDFEINAITRLLRFEGTIETKKSEAPPRRFGRAKTIATWLQRNPVLLLLAIVVDIVLVAVALSVGTSRTVAVPNGYDLDLAAQAAAASLAEVDPVQIYGPDVIRRLGAPPTRSDGKTPDVVVEHVAAGSASETPEAFEQCDERYTVTAAGYSLRCTYGSENPYGMMVRYEGRFVLRQGAVVSYDVAALN